MLPTSPLTDAKRSRLFRLAAIAMLVMVVGVNGGRYLSLPPASVAVTLAAVVVSWISVVSEGPKPVPIKNRSRRR